MSVHVYTETLLKHLFCKMIFGQFIEMFYCFLYGKWSSLFPHHLQNIYELELLVWNFTSLIHHFSSKNRNPTEFTSSPIISLSVSHC